MSDHIVPVSLSVALVLGLVAGAVTVTVRSIGTADDVTGERGVSSTVSALDPAGTFENPSTGSDGDGLYEDINGDSRSDIVDVQRLYSGVLTQ